MRSEGTLRRGVIATIDTPLVQGGCGQADLEMLVFDGRLLLLANGMVTIQATLFFVSKAGWQSGRSYSRPPLLN